MSYKVSGNFYSLIKPLLKCDIDLKKKTCLIVNVNPFDPEAHKFFENLTKLNKNYKEHGLEIFCFPCFQFGGKGTREDVVMFSKDHNYDIGEILDEIIVNGPDAPDLYKYLKLNKPRPQGGFISEDFTHFIVDKRGNIFARCGQKELYNIDHILYQLL